MKKSYVKKILLASLLFLFSFQILRVFLSSMMWKMLWTLGNPALLSLIACGIFLLTFLSVPLRRGLGERTAFAAAAGGLIFSRFFLQLMHDPLAASVISCVGLVFAELYIVLLFQSDSSSDEGSAISVPAFALPAALLADTVSRTLLYGYDLAWRQSGAAVSIGVFICVAAFMLLVFTLPSFKSARQNTENGIWKVVTLSMLGPWLYLSMALLQNPAALSGLSGWNDVTSHVAVTALNAAGFIVCIVGSIVTPRMKRFRGPLAGAVLFLSVYAVFRRVPGTPVLVCAAVIASWAAVGSIIPAAVASGKPQAGSFRTPAAVFTGMLAMLVMVFMHAQFSSYAMLVVAAAWIGIASSLASRADEKRTGHFRSTVSAAAFCGIIALSAAGSWAVLAKVPAPSVKAETGSVKIMTWNIHQGFSQQMKMDLDSIADVISRQNPDILALQEVNRAQITNGGTDVLLYLSRKCSLPYVYGANYPDGQYGNALLTRYPVTASHNKIFNINRSDPRGFLTADIQVGGKNVRLMISHTDYIYDDPAKNIYSLRKEQHSEIINAWNNEPRTVIMGDLNAEPDSAEMKIFYDRGLRDALAERGRKYDKTFWEGWGDPALRLDYIFTTKDIRVLRADIDQSKASDHKAVTAELLLP